MGRPGSRIHCQPPPTADCLLIDPGLLRNGDGQGSGTAGGATHEGLAGAFATPDNSRLSEVKFGPDVKLRFCFQSRGGPLVLHIEIPDLEIWAEVLSTHYQLVLFRVCGSPVGFFVYSFPCLESAKVVELPNVEPDIQSSRSFGIVCDASGCDKYVVACLQIGHNGAFLYRWWHSSSWSAASGRRETITLPSNMEINLGEWRTGQVIPCSIFKTSHNVLLFVDLKQGIIVCRNVMKEEENAVKFEFIRLPWVDKCLSLQEKFSSVGYYKGKLKFVTIDTSDVNKVHITVNALKGRSWQKTSQFSLLGWNHWADANIKCSPGSHLPRMYTPCFPVLSASENNILYLIMAGEDKKQAWLLKVKFDAKSGCLEGAVEYHEFWNHFKPPYPSNYI